jgi:hypothetical protein
MAKVQTRRSVSIRGATHRALKERCDKAGVSLSFVVEALIERLGNGPLPTKPPIVTVPREPRPKPDRSTLRDIDVSDKLHTRVFEVAFKTQSTMGQTLDGAINRMLDSLEQDGAA